MLALRERAPILLGTAVAGLAALALSCGGGGGTETLPATDYGQELFSDPSLSNSSFNVFSCATCHSVQQDDSVSATGRIYPGATMFDAANRPDWIDRQGGVGGGGGTVQFLDAVNFCMQFFMRGSALAPGDPRGDALYEYLASIAPDPAPPRVTYTMILTIQGLPVSTDVAHGQVIYQEACQGCHGNKDTGDGRIGPAVTILNSVLSADYNTLFPGIDHHLIVTEKVRHGQFYGIGGNMPFFSVERLADSDLEDLEAYLNL